MSALRKAWPLAITIGAVYRFAAFVCLAVATTGCAGSTERQQSRASATAQLVFLTRKDCENTPVLRSNLDGALKALGMPADYQVVDISVLPATDVRHGYPTPTLLYANRDLFGFPEPTPPFPAPT
jgi:hypothetical protein